MRIFIATHERVLIVVLFVLAFVIRMANWMTIPTFTDEYKEVELSFEILEKNVPLLVNVSSYNGPLTNYANALLFLIFGYNLYSPRALVLVVGALTVLVTYYLGKAIGDRDWRVGALAALLLAVNSHHILINSHVAWANSTTPFFSTLALLLYWHASRRGKPLWLVPAGFLFGLALQTHPATLVFAFPLCIDLLSRRETRALFKTPLPYLALIAAMIAYMPVIYYSLANSWDALATARARIYAFETEPNVQTTVARLGIMMSTLANVGIGIFGERRSGDAAGLLAFAGFWGLTIVSILYLARRKEFFPLLIAVTSVLLYATFNRFYTLPDSGRYFQPLLPVFFSAWGKLFVHGWDGDGRFGQLAKWIRRPLIVSSICVLCFTPLLTLYDFYDSAQRNGRTNQMMLELVETIQQDRASPILLDKSLEQVRTGYGVDVVNQLMYLLRLSRRTFQLVSFDKKGDVQNLLNGTQKIERAFIITRLDSMNQFGNGRVTPLLVTRNRCPDCNSSQTWGLFRWEMQP